MHTPYIPLQDFSPVATVFTSHVDAFWSFYLVDLREAIRVEDDIILKLQLFHTVNQYFSSQRECVCVCVCVCVSVCVCVCVCVRV